MKIINGCEIKLKIVCSDIDLSGVDLSYVNLYGVVFINVNFNKIDLRYVNLSYVMFKKSNLDYVDLVIVNLKYVDLCSLRVCNVNLEGVDGWVFFG